MTSDLAHMSAELQVAIDAFRHAEKTRLAADVAEQRMSDALTALAKARPEDKADYFALTEAIRAEYDNKRSKARL